MRLCYQDYLESKLLNPKNGLFLFHVLVNKGDLNQMLSRTEREIFQGVRLKDFCREFIRWASDDAVAFDNQEKLNGLLKNPRYAAEQDSPAKMSKSATSSCFSPYGNMSDVPFRGRKI